MTISYDPSGPTTPQTTFGFYEFPYASPFVPGDYYTPNSSDGVATYYLTQQLLGSPNIFLAVYEGVPGDAQLVQFDFGPTPPVSIVSTSPNDWSGMEGASFFAVAVGYTNFS